MPTTNSILRDSLFLTDLSGDAITVASLDDFAATAILLGAATTAEVSITEEGDGWYGIAFTPTASGRWRLTVTYDDDGFERMFTETYDVENAATNQAVASDGIVSIVDTGTRVLTATMSMQRVLTGSMRVTT